MNTEKTSKIDDALMCVSFARDRILPLSYDRKDMNAMQQTLLEARDALQEWYDTLTNETKTVTGNEKRYIVSRIEKVKKFLEEQISEYHDRGSDFVEAEEASEELEKALEALE